VKEEKEKITLSNQQSKKWQVIALLFDLAVRSWRGFG
jgi:hypothetical protein